MYAPKIESLTFAQIKQRTQAGNAEFTGGGWDQKDPENLLSSDFRSMSETLKSWMKPEHGWDLQAVTAILKGEPTPKRGYGEKLQITPDRLTMMFTFAADNPPTEGGGVWGPLFTGSKKLALKQVFADKELGAQIFLFYEPGIPKTRGTFDATQIGSLRLWGDTVEGGGFPYYLLGEPHRRWIKELTKPGIQDHTFKTDQDTPSYKTGEVGTAITFTVQAEDFAEKLRLESNRLRRAIYSYDKNFPKP
jgi:hypothetical protein